MSDLNLKHIAKLSKLYFKEEELAVYESQVAGILKFAEELKEVNVDGVEPTSHPLAIKNVFREDTVQPSGTATELMKHSPAVYRHFFEVPKVIEGQ